MREIKFRVWDNENKHFWEDGKSGKNGYKWNEDWLCITMNGQVAIFDTEPYGGESGEQDRFVIQQYTGEVDKNGKEIYEGDIVEIQLYDDPVPNKITATVEWFDYGWKYKMKGGYGGFGGDEEFVEVVGNIYENEELLK